MIKPISACLAVISLLLVSGALTAAEPDFSADSEPAAIWVDVRSWAETKIDRIEGDLHIPHGEILSGIQKLNLATDTPIYLYCARGGRAQNALQQLQAEGYTQVENAGGIEQARVHAAREQSGKSAKPVN